MNCPYCEVESTFFEKPDAHLVITRKGEHVFIHAPFDKPGLLVDMINKLIIEAEKHGVIYKPNTSHQKGN